MKSRLALLGQLRRVDLKGRILEITESNDVPLMRGHKLNIKH